MGALRRVLLLLVSLAASGLLAEGVTRLAGYDPWPTTETILGDNQNGHRVDPTRGWEKVPGSFRNVRAGRTVVATHWSNDARATAERELSSDRRVVLLGGSFAYGFGLNDSETFAWLLKETTPDIEWLNLATSGYGTYQSLLTLERYFGNEELSPIIVIYGFNWFHERRNVAADPWQYAMAYTSPGIRLSIPYVVLERGENLERKIHIYPDWPLKRVSAAVALAERAFNKLQISGRAERGPAVMRALLLEMNRLTRERGSRLLILVMGARCDYFEFFEQANIEFVNCRPPTYSPEMSLSDGHPSARRNLHYAECLGSYLRQNELLDENLEGDL